LAGLALPVGARLASAKSPRLRHRHIKHCLFKDLKADCAGAAPPGRTPAQARAQEPRAMAKNATGDAARLRLRGGSDSYELPRIGNLPATGVGAAKKRRGSGGHHR
jgi:hypothetical protein